MFRDMIVCDQYLSIDLKIVCEFIIKFLCIDATYVSAIFVARIVCHFFFWQRNGKESSTTFLSILQMALEWVDRSSFHTYYIVRFVVGLLLAYGTLYLVPVQWCRDEWIYVNIKCAYLIKFICTGDRRFIR